MTIRNLSLPLSLPSATLYRQLVGFEEIFKNLEFESSSKYPLVNILKKDNTYRLEFALAGFSKQDIEVVQDGNMLTIRTIEGQTNRHEGWEFLHHDIAARPFTRSFRLVEFLEVRNVSMDQGILTIDLELEVPDRLKPKYFQVK